MNSLQDFRAAMHAARLDYLGPIAADGKLHRIKVEGDHERNSWYVLHDGSPAADAFGCWKRGLKETWCDCIRQLSQADWDRVREQWQETDRQREQADAERQEKARKTAQWILARAQPVTGHAYLTAKGVQPHGDQRGGRYRHAGQMRQDHTGLGHGQFADHQRSQILHARRVTGALRQPQGGVGRHTPLTGAFAVAPGALDRDRTSAGLERAPMAGRATREGVPADRAERRRGVGFGLGPKLQGVAEQFPNVLGDLDFEMAEVLVTRAHEALDRKFQRARHARSQWRERGGGASSEGGGGRLAAGNGHA